MGSNLEPPAHSRLGGEIDPRRLLIAAACLIVFSACATAKPPIPNPNHVAATPHKDDFTVQSQAGQPVGEVQPVYISAANGMDVTRSIEPSQIFAIDDAGDRVAPLPPGEAARIAGGAHQLSSAVSGAAKTGTIAAASGGLMGAALGTLGGLIFGAVGTGAAAGAATGAAAGLATGAVGGAFAGEDSARQTANAQLSALALPAGPVHKNFTVSGYVFFPRGNYTGLEVITVGDSGETDTVRLPWQ